MALSNADRQKRYQERARDALRNAKAAGADPKPGASSSLVPLRLPSERPAVEPLGDDEEEREQTKQEKLEEAAEEIVDQLVWTGGRRGHTEIVTRHAEDLIALIERDPADFVDFIRRFIAEKVAEFERSKQPKRKGTRA
jgi:hypothetical protein